MHHYCYIPLWMMVVIHIIYNETSCEQNITVHILLNTFTDYLFLYISYTSIICINNGIISDDCLLHTKLLLSGH